MKNRRVSALLIIMVVVALSLVFASVVMAGPETKATLTAEMSGAREVPGPGDADGMGWATIRLNVHTQTVCWELSVQDIAPATAAHIHVGRGGIAGPVVVPLSPPTDGWSSGCASGVDKALIRDIISHPTKYYVNVHNADYPSGAVRGQLN